MMRPVTAARMREIERIAVEEYGLPAIVLMENAGKAVADAVVSLARGRKSLRVAVFCGSGNNGGDGLVAARYLANRGYQVEVFTVRPPEELRGDAQINARVAERMGIPVKQLETGVPYPGFDAAVDALLGTGARGDVSGICRSAIDLMNVTDLPVVSVDIPSGIDADTGKVLGAAVRADITVTMGLPKQGLLTPEGRRWTGEIIIADIGLPRRLIEG